MTGSAKQSIVGAANGRVDCFFAALLAMTLPQFPKQDSAFSRRDASEFLQRTIRPENQRAQGMPGARCTRSLVCDKKQTHERSHHGHTGTTRHSPRNGFTAYFALSPVTRLV